MLRLEMIAQDRNLVNRSVESELGFVTVKEKFVRIDAV